MGVVEVRTLCSGLCKSMRTQRCCFVSWLHPASSPEESADTVLGRGRASDIEVEVKRECPGESGVEVTTKLADIGNIEHKPTTDDPAHLINILWETYFWVKAER